MPTAGVDPGQGRRNRSRSRIPRRRRPRRDHSGEGKKQGRKPRGLHVTSHHPEEAATSAQRNPRSARQVTRSRGVIQSERKGGNDSSTELTLSSSEEGVSSAPQTLRDLSLAIAGIRKRRARRELLNDVPFCLVDKGTSNHRAGGDAASTFLRALKANRRAGRRSGDFDTHEGRAPREKEQRDRRSDTECPPPIRGDHTHGA